MNDFYVDRFLKFNVSQGVARLDFARMDAFDPEKNEVTMSPAGRLVMPLESFMHLADEVAKIKTQVLNQAKGGEAKKKIDQDSNKT